MAFDKPKKKVLKKYTDIILKIRHIEAKYVMYVMLFFIWNVYFLAENTKI